MTTKLGPTIITRGDGAYGYGTIKGAPFDDPHIRSISYPYAVRDALTLADGTVIPAGNHGAIDIPCPIGTPVVALADGVVHRRGVSEFGGNWLTVRYGNGGPGTYYSRYVHLSTITAGPDGSVVRRGDAIAASGNTGKYTTGPHLHLEVSVVEASGWTVVVDPLTVLRSVVEPREPERLTPEELAQRIIDGRAHVIAAIDGIADNAHTWQVSVPYNPSTGQYIG